MEQKTAHGIRIENRNYLNTFGISEVASFTETEAKLKLSDGGRLVIVGEKLQMADFDKKTGELSLGGKINSVKYIDAGLSSPKRFFK